MMIRQLHRSLFPRLLGGLCLLLGSHCAAQDGMLQESAGAKLMRASRIPIHKGASNQEQSTRIVEGPGSIRLTGSLPQDEMGGVNQEAEAFPRRDVPAIQARRMTLPTPIYRSSRHAGRPARDEATLGCPGCGQPHCPSLNVSPLGAAAGGRPAPGEYVCDGDDNGARVTVDGEFNLYGVDAEDTFGHFDTLDGRRLVSPSNKVCIYSPRFSAVRKLSDYRRNSYTQSPNQTLQRVPIQQADGEDFASTTKQHLQLERLIGRKRASGLMERTRAVTVDAVTILNGIHSGWKPYEDLGIIRFGRFSSAEGPRLTLGMQSANVWRDDLGLQAFASNVSPVIVNEVYQVQQLDQIETDDDNAVLRVVKVASRLSGRPGDVIEFTIRYDNLSGRPVGNVTLVDNLTGRLEYIADSAESSLKANFFVEENEVGSEMLRWEIIDPVPAGEGGVIRFQCRVR